MSIVTICKTDEEMNRKYFFSTDHCQPNLGDDWVPVTHYNKTREQVKEQEDKWPVEGRTSTEIPNPDKNYQA